jgi:predicted transposase/invertase (TIGR01784 family)
MPEYFPFNITHDSFLRSILSDRGAAIAFMQTFLPDSVSDRLDIEAFTHDSTTFLSRDMSTRYADLLFEIPVKNSAKKVTVAILVELKSVQEKYVSFQLLEYVALAYRKQVKKKRRLQLIIPVIYYHGKSRWVPKSTIDFFEDVPPDFIKYIPQFDQIFIDLKGKPAEEIDDIRDGLLKTAIQIQFLRFLEQLDTALLIKIFTGLDAQKYGNYIQPILVYLYKYNDLSKDYTNFMSELPEPIKSKTMTTYERILADGEAIGIEKGIAKGKAEGEAKSKIDVVLRAHSNGIDITMIANITGLSIARIQKILTDHGKKKSQ